jgi:hypothetical protein
VRDDEFAIGTAGGFRVVGSGMFSGDVRTEGKFYGNGSEITGVTVDSTTIHHGSLIGLADDDHTQYLLADGTRAVSGAMTFSTMPVLSTGSGTGYVLSSSNAGGTVQWTQQKINIPVSATVLKGTTTAGAGDTNKYPESIEIAPSGMNIDFMAFDGGATNENAFFTLSLPIGWNEGPISYKAKWSAAAGSAGDTVLWQLKGVTLSDGDSMTAPSFASPVEVSDALGTVDTMRITAESDPLTIGGSPAAGDSCQFVVTRNSAVDTHTTDARLHEIILTFTRDTPTDS